MWNDIGSQISCYKITSSENMKNKDSFYYMYIIQMDWPKSCSCHELREVSGLSFIMWDVSQWQL